MKPVHPGPKLGSYTLPRLRNSWHAMIGQDSRVAAKKQRRAMFVQVSDNSGHGG